jgi:hypothetical protein
MFKYDKPEEFIPACKVGDIKKIKSIVARHTVNLNDGLSQSTLTGQKEVVQFLINKGATNLNQCLKIACETNNYFLSELLIQKGAKVEVGLRFSNSPNITRMLYRYKQKSEMIN